MQVCKYENACAGYTNKHPRICYGTVCFPTLPLASCSGWAPFTTVGGVAGNAVASNVVLFSHIAARGR